MEVLEEEGTLVDPLPSGPILLDGKPTRAPAVLTLDNNGAALWLIDLSGQPCGAWTSAPLDTEGAERLMGLLAGRALISVERKSLQDTLDAVAESAKVKTPQELVEHRLCSIADLLDDVAAVRRESAAAVRAEEDSGRKKLAPLRWKGTLPEGRDLTLDELRSFAGIVKADKALVGEALDTARVARWAIGLWTETEGARVRRPYLRRELGVAQPLPLSWRRAITLAYESPFVT
jgi:hypothetical protein